MLQSPGGEVVWFGQPTFTENLLKKYEMQHAKPAATASAADSKLVKRKDGEEGVDLKMYQAAVGALLGARHFQ